jgi:hypothetical protein
VTRKQPPRWPPEPASPLQRRGTSRAWYAPTTRDFIRLLRFRAQAGEIYAVIGEHSRADILVRSIDTGPDRWVRGWTYPADGLRAMKESGLLSMVQVDAIPDFDPESIQQTEADRRRFGPDPEFWRIELPSTGEPVRYPNARPYRGRR